MEESWTGFRVGSSGERTRACSQTLRKELEEFGRPVKLLFSCVMDLRGCGTALVTPFQQDGSIDTDRLASLVDRQILSGTHYLVACGTTGETPTLSEAEWLDVIRIVAEVTNGRVPVLAGCTHSDTRTAVERAAQAATIRGVSALLTANPPYNKPTQEGQLQHFLAIAQSVAIPVMLYNIPGRTAANLEPPTVVRLARECPNIRGVKESSGNLRQITELIHMAPEGFRVYAGDDDIALAAIAVGASGVVSVASNEIPAEMAQMIEAALSGNWTVAREMHRRWYPLLLANFWETSPGPVKYVMKRMGLIEANYRLPMVVPSAATTERLDRLISELGLAGAGEAGPATEVKPG
jgi:4-hydroxy-tetrahydrodipicolinate synthase